MILILKELASKQSAGLPAYFKGGTALYKALKTTNRFSEDIDLSVDSRECSRTQNDKRLGAATKQYVALQRDSSMGETKRSEVVSAYRYDLCVLRQTNITASYVMIYLNCLPRIATHGRVWQFSS